MLKENIRGVYPTMITPFYKGKIDFEAVASLVEWYGEQGCDGIFAACQSSEIIYLSLEERVELTRAVVKKNRELKRPMTIVASGHISDSFDEQVRELNLIAAEKPDALILISNRIDIENTTDEKWIADAERLISCLPDNMPLGIYECPKPYKRLLTPKMIKWCLSTGRFRFIKDTCCDADMMKQRLEMCRGSELHLFNANAQTLSETLKHGASGYCGVMANFHPRLYLRLMKCYENDAEAAGLIQSFLGTAAFTESLAYPVTAKYYLRDFVKLPIKSLQTRTRSENDLKDYDKECIRQMSLLAEKIMLLTE